MTFNKFELGDYQTPLYFCDKVVNILKEKYRINPSIIIEPTMGLGNFLLSSHKCFNEAKLVGIEINNEYIEKFKENNIECNLYNSNIFEFDFSIIKDYSDSFGKDILFIGNPPWVTNSELSSIGSFNLPYKDNFKKNKGFEAITGKGNFDICEYIILQVLSEFSNYEGAYFSFLCKETVAKNIIRDLPKYNFNLEFSDIYNFNANEVFDVSCDAVLFVAKITKKETSLKCGVYDINNPFICKHHFGYINNVFVSDIDNYKSDIDGCSQIQWRQGVKHDCSKVMELKLKNGLWYNGYGEKIDFIDSDFIYPLIKSSGFKERVITDSAIKVIITQKYVREDTLKLKNDDKLWNYLTNHIDDFNKRKSTIYKNTPLFSIFGIGDYSFLKYKIGLSGFYKEPKFSFLTNEKTFMLDDTSYFIGSNDLNEAQILMAILDNENTYKFLKSISFPNSKRPFTKDILQRLDLVKMINVYGNDYISHYVKHIFNRYISDKDIEQYKEKLCKK